ncbi:MAG: hypothetical protein ABIG40_02370 [Parcubacteria group bacterium]
MQYLLFFVAAVAIFANYFLTSESGNLQNKQEATLPPTIEKSIKGASTGAGTESAPGFLLDTFIASGPDEGEVVYNLNKVVFKFSGISTLAQGNGVSYETKIIGLDSQWQPNSSGERVVEFPASSKEYTFLARTKAGGYYDTTPARRTFQIKVPDNYGKVRISGISLKSINLTVNLKKGENLNISGWKIVSKNGEFVIPQAAKIYPFSNSGSAENTFVASGESIYIKNDISPLGTSLAFKPNKCFGYLGSYSSNFPFSYSKICPRIDEDDICNFSPSCRALILRLNSCSQPAFSTVEYPFCWEYVSDYTSKNLNYNGCINNYIRDSDFFGSTWYIYTSFLPVCDCGDDTVYLYDQNGFLVAKRDYNL